MRRLAARIRVGLAAIAVGCAGAAAAQSSIEVLPAQGQVYLLVGPGGNTTVQIGDEAVVVVDTQTAAASDAVLDAIERLSSRPIRHIIVTSADTDHTGGNESLARAGTYVRLIDSFDPRGSDTNASIMAHVNVLAAMSAPTGEEASAPADAWPTDTYFTSDWALFVNGEAIRMLHVPAAHTDGDSLVFFRRSDVISTGDIFNTDRYPPFDVAAGGSIAGIIDGLNLIIELAIPGENQEGGTVVVPGHGRLSDETDVANYRDMVTIVRDRVQALIDEGRTLEQVQAAQPTRDYDGRYAVGSVGWSGTEFVAAIYQDLKLANP
jgi:glyoxylase-like metal-dependent hydrolase (beta-lactamase superfamily II)